MSARAPLRVYWELTRACDLACRHCRAEAQPERAADELTTNECRAVLADLALAGPPRPHVIFTGGDPLKRPDLLLLVRAAVDLGLGVSVAPSATLALDGPTVRALRDAGVSAMSLSLDGSTPARHDAVRGVLGCYGWTLAAAAHVTAAGVPLQINTLVTRETHRDLEDLAKVVARLGAARWSLFFLVPVGRGRVLIPLDARQAETTLGWVARNAARWPFTVTTTEAPHFRRVMVQQMRAEGRSGEEIRSSAVARGFGIRDGNGIMFVAANGDVSPSGFLPLVAGNVRRTSPRTLYRDDAVFEALRNPEAFRGRCGVCDYRALCGGSRARAWAVAGDVLGSDPLCAWEPTAAM
ncbi:MAG TPA: TIGR04053 family radical SAM/SPASM domain-containing protein [Methylomirabilota bacterium]|nr:TIGR04053 family radical SAM/SPASM domain-containing protein [Methylomirabilota bacterium]